MGFQKLGEPYKNTTKVNKNKTNKKPVAKGGQSYMWKVSLYDYKKTLFGKKEIFVKAELFNNKIDAMKYQNESINKGYKATIEKFDPTKSN